MLMEGKGDAGRPRMWEADLARAVQARAPSPADEEIDFVLRLFLDDAGLLERVGKDRTKGLLLQLTDRGCAEAKYTMERAAALLGRG